MMNCVEACNSCVICCGGTVCRGPLMKGRCALPRQRCHGRCSPGQASKRSSTPLELFVGELVAGQLVAPYFSRTAANPKPRLVGVP